MTAILEAAALSLPGRLQPTDLRIDAPSLVCLVGPNGSGKTSLLHALARIAAPAGRLRIAGEEPDRLPPPRRKRLLAFLPASRDVAWPVTARDLVSLGGGDSAAEASLAALDAAGFADRRVDRLSTGERSRVLIARALSQQAKLVLLDEPAANLDPAWQLRLMALLKETAAAAAVVAAMHDLDLAARFADRLIVMDEGRIVADGAPAEIVESGEIARVFGIARGADGAWRLVSPSADPRSSR